MKFQLNGTGTFAITDWFYLSIMDGGGDCCQNCGKLITTIVTVQRNDGKSFKVGSDCAKTLSGVNKKAVNDIEREINRDAKRLKETKDGNYFFTDGGENVNVLKWCTQTFDGRPYFCIHYHCSISKKMYGKKPFTSIQDVENIAPELLDTYGFKASFLNKTYEEITAAH